MDEMNVEERAETLVAYRKFMASQQTLLLSTASCDGLPEASYAPFVRDDAGAFYIFVSELARHTGNLLKNPQAAVLFIRPESESQNVFARERVVFRCSVTEVGSDETLYLSQINALQQKFGDVVSILRTLTDFHLFALKPESGQYVVGFGRAYAICLDRDDLMYDIP